MKKSIGSYPRVRVEGGGRGVVSQAGSVLLVEDPADGSPAGYGSACSPPPPS
ncbi:hypothetical protein [Streptomyces sp. NPDC059949]|uniref:hypothetical protein n=1 Tax=Streptomyces sp. NPDC059949 TaxID=3347013 RepID=UPI00364B4ED3